MADQATPKPWRDDPHKMCARCLVSKPVSEFGAKRPGEKWWKSGYKSWCRDCSAARAREWRAEHPEYVAAYNEKRRAAPLELVCGDCQGTFVASTRLQVRCGDCQALMRAGRKR